MDDLPVMSVAGACKAVAVTVGGSVAVECIQSFMGIPRDVVYGSLFGAVIGLARSNERPKVGVPSTRIEWINGVASLLWLLFFVIANACACAWVCGLACTRACATIINVSAPSLTACLDRGLVRRRRRAPSGDR